MLYLFVALISFCASFVGAICGVGGGVIIKPLLDATGIYSVSVISFLSGCTVLAMTTYSVGREFRKRNFGSKTIVMVILAAGAALGGVAGKSLFTGLRIRFGNDFLVGAVQSCMLLLITAATLIYTLFKTRIRKRDITNKPGVFAVGAILGIVSAFLGIGGGPVNIVVLSYCFSMEPKEAAKSSLFIILWSQMTSFVTTVVTGTVPDVDGFMLIMMIVIGIIGGITGRKLNDLIEQRTVDRLFIFLLLVIIGITAYNFGTNLVLLA